MQDIAKEYFRLPRQNHRRKYENVDNHTKIELKTKFRKNFIIITRMTLYQNKKQIFDAIFDNSYCSQYKSFGVQVKNGNFEYSISKDEQDDIYSLYYLKRILLETDIDRDLEIYSLDDSNIPSNVDILIEETTIRLDELVKYIF
jgi:hypothetical protein